MIDKILIMKMFNKMDDNFKENHKNQIQSMLETYPCICLVKEDLIGYAKNECTESPETIEKIVEHIKKIDYDDMQNIADDFANDCVMNSYWYFVEDQLDLIKREIEKQQ